jgi:hypothetical protein
LETVSYRFCLSGQSSVQSERVVAGDCFPDRLLRRRPRPGASRVTPVQRFPRYRRKSGGDEHAHLVIVPGGEFVVGQLLMPEISNKMIRKGLAFLRKQSGTVVSFGL